MEHFFVRNLDLRPRDVETHFGSQEAPAYDVNLAIGWKTMFTTEEIGKQTLHEK